MVDLSTPFGPARDQGKRPTCVAFSMSDLNQFHHGSDLLSPEFLYQSAAHLDPNWAPNCGMDLLAGIDVLGRIGQPTDHAAPYLPVEPLVKPASAPSSPPPLYEQDFRLHRPDSSTIEQSLKAGIPVGLLMLLTTDFFTPADGVIAFSPNAIAKSNHAVIACGLAAEPCTGETLFKLRNSWGLGWGIEGHAWVSARYIDHHSLAVYRIP